MSAADFARCDLSRKDGVEPCLLGFSASRATVLISSARHPAPGISPSPNRSGMFLSLTHFN
jgi:hypothetical protein